MTNKRRTNDEQMTVRAARANEQMTVRATRANERMTNDERTISV
ncbi:MAG: hypothetical protein E6494_10990 [Capnocytophaga sp.]|nr:hypothetical protein [Capnocytophaga sp.]MDU6660615.1 hypothetical protein [Capnocytophaga sp.]